MGEGSLEEASDFSPPRHKPRNDPAAPGQGSVGLTPPPAALTERGWARLSPDARDPARTAHLLDAVGISRSTVSCAEEGQVTMLMVMVTLWGIHSG